MSLQQIIKCRICGKLLKRHAYQVYDGDESCCKECNQEADENMGKSK